MTSGEVEIRRDRIKDGEFREWSFPIEEILQWVRTFLHDAGYEIVSPEHIGLVMPHIRARRKEEDRTYEIVVVGAQHTDTAIDGLTKLSAAASVLGEKADYVLVMPPISEYLLLDFLRGDKGRWYFAMKDLGLMMWLANPDEEFTWSVVGEPRDKIFREMFAVAKISVDFILMRELTQQRWEEEEED